MPFQLVANAARRIGACALAHRGMAGDCTVAEQPDGFFRGEVTRRLAPAARVRKDLPADAVDVRLVRATQARLGMALQLLDGLLDEPRQYVIVRGRKKKVLPRRLPNPEIDTFIDSPIAVIVNHLDRGVV